MVDLKERLIQRIKETQNPEVLKEVYRLLELELDDQDSFELSEDQITAVREAQAQISNGALIDHEVANAKTEEWLRKR